MLMMCFTFSISHRMKKVYANYLNYLPQA
jgi:hypothetical protein